MIREKFLNLKFPVFPYCNMYRSPSTKFHEGFHIKNDFGITLNFHWRCDGILTIGFYDKNKKYEGNRLITIKDNITNITEKEINDICNEYLRG